MKFHLQLYSTLILIVAACAPSPSSTPALSGPVSETNHETPTDPSTSTLAEVTTDGGERGAGDELAGDVWEVIRTVDGYLDAWVSKGILQIKSSEIKKIHDLVNSMNPIQLIVRTEEQVFLTEPQDGKSAGDEVDIVRFAKESPKRLLVGRKRWRENTSIQREKDIVHELVALAEIHDDRFEVSYAVYRQAQEDWKSYRSQVLRAIEGASDGLFKLMTVNSFPLETFVSTVKQTNDYKRCQASQKMKRKKQIEDCRGVFDLIYGSSTGFLRIDHVRDEKLIRSEILKFHSDFVSTVRFWELSRPNWGQWGRNLLNEYTELNNFGVGAWENAANTKRILDYLEEQCPSPDATYDSLGCLLSSLDAVVKSDGSRSSKIAEHFERVRAPIIETFRERLNQLRMKILLAVDPI